MTDTPLWVFGYGSLIWRPGFEFRSKQIARLSGYRRSFCMRSIHYRGTAEQPGLVLALDREEGVHCDGIGFEIAPEQADQTLEYLRERELISYAYNEATLPLDLKDGRQVMAVTFVMNPEHDQYCGRLSLEEQAEIIARAEGTFGPNVDYLENTTSHLRELGIEDPELIRLREYTRKILS
ncbi:gamma-glutamylcyclotransferase [Halocynthiibacter sp. C4]|uniref:gamma-glutamylcyclotransferase n=1 Tax=Halocynthiibacter sp. C4 TaxID=2992758 RepID=UPI00237B1813|nr:gamma-glutamylcyclotransferase [Halocynthiibacter sp. C4]MDE0590304.1 gamma-glutamylcyclotransferase [Halocynthiibacter sp. C4]